MHLLSIVGSESAGKPWRSVARRDDARTGASSGYKKDWHQPLKREEEGEEQWAELQVVTNAFKRAALVCSVSPPDS